MRARTPEQIAQCARGELITFLDYPQGTEGPIRERLVPIDDIPEEPVSGSRKALAPVGEGITVLQEGAPVTAPRPALSPAEIVRRYPKAARKAGIR